VTNHHVPHFPQWAASGAKVVAADFDGDTRADLALVGGPGWITVPFALSNGDGDFTAASLPLNDIPAWSRDARFALAGKFNHDGQADLALAGGAGWKSAPVALFSR
ncbi:MAG TPA: FG-GAP-like repeat-containing protein, partial [Polyangiaceae bacterium]|nr:FG-GAP-like repeat-containing protein [Polyangiaceae bacterium]